MFPWPVELSPDDRELQNRLVRIESMRNKNPAKLPKAFYSPRPLQRTPSPTVHTWTTAVVLEKFCWTRLLFLSYLRVLAELLCPGNYTLRCFALVIMPRQP